MQALLIEADDDFVFLVARALGWFDIGVDRVDSGKRAVARARELEPALIVLSVEIPGMNGYAICNAIKRDEALKNIPLILVSSNASREVFAQHRKLRIHADAYFHKGPAFSLDAFAAQVAKLLPDAKAPIRR